MSKKLTIKQEKFVLKYFECGNASESYKYAYSTKRMKDKTINEVSSKLLNDHKITTRLNELRNAQQKRFELTSDDLIRQLGAILLYDPLDVWDANGNVRPLNEIPKELRVLINGVKRKDTYGEVSSEEVEYKMACKDKARLTLMKQKGMFAIDNSQKAGLTFEEAIRLGNERLKREQADND